MLKNEDATHFIHARRGERLTDASAVGITAAAARSDFQPLRATENVPRNLGTVAAP
jgi:hypothetical protein